MLSALQSASIIVSSILVALLVMWAFRRTWLAKKRNQHNELIGWQIGFLGTTYAVIIAFMLADVWNDYQAAETNAEIEANSVINMYRVAEGLPEPSRAGIENLAKEYADAMIDSEWPAMMRGVRSAASSQIVAAMWKEVLGIQATTPVQQTSLQQELTDLSNMTEHRRIRQLQSRSSLPGIFWLVLIVGGVMTVLYTCLLDVEDTMMHVIQVIGVSFIVSLVLVTIADVDAPYGGAVHIQPTAFQLVQQAIGGTQNR